MAISDIHSNLSEREKSILQTIVHLYILKASPIGSRYLAKYFDQLGKLSPATIRNVMADLEEMNYISHPHTSAGRIPTDKGYRFFVDSLNDIESLSGTEIKTVQEIVSSNYPEDILRDASKVLGALSNFLGIVEIPHLEELKVERIEIIPLSTTRLLVVLALDSKIVRTVNLEAEFEIDLSRLSEIWTYINEKISGKPLRFLRDNFSQMMQDSPYHDRSLVKVFIESVDKIFEYHGAEDRLIIAGTKHLLKNPEFEDIQKVRGIFEILENEEIIVNLLEKSEEETNPLKILIGKEIKNEKLDDYSIVISSYQFGSATGSIGLIGPKRMNYPKMISLVQHVAKKISQSVQ
ncbi:MAG: Heat-inducible transcription repressor HrcA [Ignavibacteria bacterium]|nr:Heat-inducible transcription repressor HrcA [Ignavibacteria bacterium]